MVSLELEPIAQEMRGWRRALHSRPELAFNERETARFIADRLRDFNFDSVVEGVGGTGIVGTLRRGDGNRAIALRADMDALPLTEAVGREHRSKIDGHMHACGHDGHVAMLLGAAKWLAHHQGFSGTVHFLFQPAEECGLGALAMLDDGLLKRFPFDEIYGLHNLPGLPVGHFQARPGIAMSAEDLFEIVVSGRGGHAAKPNWSEEAMVAACAIVLSLQSIVSRRIDPAETAVVSVTEFVTDGARNVLPGTVSIKGDARSYTLECSKKIEDEIRKISAGITSAYGISSSVSYRREFIPLKNDLNLTEEVLCCAKAAFGESGVSVPPAPVTISEDFARFLEFFPGCFAFIGNGFDSEPLHSANYDFNDDALVPGAQFFVDITRRRLCGQEIRM